jgi:trans-aconitate 2-methyltransferase
LDGRLRGHLRNARDPPVPGAILTSSSRREWDARSYDAVPQPQQRWGARILELIELAGDEIVLEAGCGTGRDAARLLERLPAGRVIAVDGSEQMLGQLCNRLAGSFDRVLPVQADLAHPLPVRKVDAVFSVATFHWIADHDALFHNLATMLPPGGQLAADCGGVGNIARVRSAIGAILGPGAARGAWNFATVEHTRQRLLDAGFDPVEVSIHDEPAQLEPGEQLERFLEAVVLGWHLERMPEPERRSFVRAVAARIPDGEIDYVRLTIDARKRPDA